MVSSLSLMALYAAPNGNNEAGESYVVFGGDGVGSTGVLGLSNLDDSGGFVIKGIDIDVYDRSGYSVSEAAYINGDGVADLIIIAGIRR